MTLVALICGLAMRGSEYAPLAARLESAGLRTLTFDNLHAGEGPRLPGPLSIDAQAEHAWEQITRAAAGDDVVLFGLSMGGMIASTIAARHPRGIRQLMLAATSPNLPDGTREAVPEALYDAWVNVASQEDLMACVRIAFGETAEAQRPEIVRSYFTHRLHKKNGQSRRDFVAQLDSIRAFDGRSVYQALATKDVPTLVLAGEEDRLFPGPHSAWIAETLASPLDVLPATGHMLHLEDEAGLAARIVGGLPWHA